MSSEPSFVQAPMRKYAKSLADKAARQRRLVGAEEVEIGGRPPVDDESDDGGDPPDLELLLQLQKKKAARAKQGGQQTEAPEAEEADEEASDDESSEEEASMPTPLIFIWLLDKAIVLASVSMEKLQAVPAKDQERSQSVHKQSFVRAVVRGVDEGSCDLAWNIYSYEFAVARSRLIEPFQI